MDVQFSEQEYRRLMLLTFLGEWMINAIRKEPDPAHEDTASKVYSFAHGTPLESLVRFDKNAGNWLPTEALENEADAFIDHYDETVFWEELTSRLTERDLIKARGPRAVGGMRQDQKMRSAAPIAKAYTREFEAHGVDRLRLPG